MKLLKSTGIANILYVVYAVLFMYAVAGCVTTKEPSEQEIISALESNDLKEINNLIQRIEEQNTTGEVRIDKYELPKKQALSIAYRAKGNILANTLKEDGENLMAERVRDMILAHTIDSVLFLPNDTEDSCMYNTADELVRSCPTEEEIQQIRADFNIYFEQVLIDSGVLVPWNCTQDGSESSIMLSMYNTFRLAKCIPFDSDFPWAPGYNNLYEWLKSLNMTAIGYFWAEEGEYNHASIRDKRVYMIGNNLDDPIYREVINSRTGVGIIHAVVLLAHESTHAGMGIAHACGYGQDTNLEYMGAWAVQYYLLTMLADNTGNYFTEYQKASFRASAQRVLDTRFCETL